MTTKNLPPEGRLTDQQRAVMRTNLMAATHETPKKGRRWLTPLAVAASVAVLAGVGFAGTNTLLKNDDGGTTGVPAASGGGTPSIAPSPSPIFAANHNPPVVPGDMDLGDFGRAWCEQQALAFSENIGQLGLADSVSYDGGATYLFVQNGKYATCDDWRTRRQAYDRHLDGAVDIPYITADRSLDDRSVTRDKFVPQMDTSPVDAKAYASNGMKDSYGAGFQVHYLAAGIALEGVTAISYTFPGGDVVDATITDQMWQVVYDRPAPVASHDSGDLALPGPVVVSVTTSDGSTQEFEFTAQDVLDCWNGTAKSGC